MPLLSEPSFWSSFTQTEPHTLEVHYKSLESCSYREMYTIRYKDILRPLLLDTDVHSSLWMFISNMDSFKDSTQACLPLNCQSFLVLLIPFWLWGTVLKASKLPELTAFAVLAIPDRPSHCFLSGPWDPLEGHLLCARDPVLDAVCAVDQANMEGRIDKSCREAWCVDASSYFFPLPPWTVREASDRIQPTPTQTRNHGHLLLSTNKLALSAWKLSRKF